MLGAARDIGAAPHGGAPRTIDLGRCDGELVCRIVTPEPASGTPSPRTSPAGDGGSGFGPWLATTVSDGAEIPTGADGPEVVLRLRLRA